MDKKYTYILIILFSVTASYAEVTEIVICAGKAIKSDGVTKTLFLNNSSPSKTFLQFVRKSKIYNQKG
tara:strand:+ start:1008 stop:1211 length:204 start_codon:yes stop_codon:yes gene_type:complete